MKYEDIEAKFYKWAYLNRIRIAIFFVSYLTLYVLSDLPYINLYFPRSIVPLVGLFIGVFILKIPIRKIFLITSGLFLVCLMLTLLGWPGKAESLGNFIYALFLAATIKGIFSQAGKEKQKAKLPM